jgi:hypothetical protein
MFSGPYKTGLVNPSSLVGWWKFDDGLGTDSSPLGNAGTLNGTPMSPDIGPGIVLPSSLTFDRTDNYVEILAAPVTSGDLTMALWANKTVSSAGSAINLMGLFASAGGTRNSIYLTYGGSTGNQVSGIQFIGGTFNAVNGADPSISQNVWNHIAMTFVSATGAAVLYINGAQVASATLGTGYPSSLAKIDIGAEYNNATPVYESFFGGSITDARIYNRALSADEIVELYATPFQPLIDFERVPFLPSILPLMGQIWLA